MNEEIKIEKGVPMPAAKDNGTLTGVYRKMEIGDSIVSDMKQMSIHSCAASVGIKVSTRRINAGEHAGKFRIWRVK